MDPKPDTIKVTAFHREEIFASHANLYVTVKGSSLISGNEAMKKAKEVSQLVDALTRFGLSLDAIHLQGAYIETSSGTVLKSSSAVYRLKVKAEKLDQLAELLDIIAEQRNTILERIEWKYPEEEARERALESAITKAKVKAEKITAALGVKLLAVYDFVENAFDQEAPAPFPFAAQAVRMKSRAAAPEEPNLNMDIQHSKTVQVNVEIWYRVSSL